MASTVSSEGLDILHNIARPDSPAHSVLPNPALGQQLLDGGSDPERMRWCRVTELDSQ
jgi:hypothetical protein